MHDAHLRFGVSRTYFQVYSDMLIAGGGFRFACKSGAGGVLVLKDNMHGERMICARQVKQYVRRHVESWYIFLDRLGLRDELGQQDILLGAQLCLRSTNW